MIGLTGATGQIGRLVATLLADAGVAQRLLVRNPERAPRLPGADVVAAGGYADPAAARALAGVDVLLMVSAAEAEDRLTQHFAFIDAARTAGVRHVVYTSFFGASPQATFTLARDHWATEERIRSSGMRFTFLRDNLYLNVLPLFAGEDGVIRGPAGNGAIAAVARADVARVAALALRNPETHQDVTYELTGREALTLEQAANIIADVTGRPTRYHEETIEEAYASRVRFQVPPWQIDAWVSTYLAIGKGELARVTSDVARVTGEEPLTLRDVLAMSR